MSKRLTQTQQWKQKTNHDVGIAVFDEPVRIANRMRALRVSSRRNVHQDRAHPAAANRRRGSTVVQAVETAWFGPRSPCWMLTCPPARFTRNRGIAYGLTLRAQRAEGEGKASTSQMCQRATLRLAGGKGSLLVSLGVERQSGLAGVLHAADARADGHAAAVALVLTRGGPTRVGQRLRSGTG